MVLAQMSEIGSEIRNRIQEKSVNYMPGMGRIA